MYKACIFDLDGTLTDTLESLTYSVNKTLKELGFPCITEEQCRQFVGSGARALMKRALIAAGDEKLEQIGKGMEVYGRIFGENCTYHVKPYKGILEMLDKLRAMKICTAVVSNKPHAQTVDVVSQVLGRERFESISGQREGINRKPDPAGVLEAIRTLGIAKEECLYIGDSEVDVETAKRAGIPCTGVTWGFRSRETLVKAGVDYIIETPLELIEII